MSNDILKSISDHLEFLGYEVTPVSDDLKAIKAIHPKRSNFLVRPFREGFLFTTVFGTKLEAIQQNRERTLEEMNSINRDLSAMRAYLDKDNDLLFDAWYPAIYDKKQLALFLDLINRDIEQVAIQAHPAMREFVK